MSSCLVIKFLCSPSTDNCQLPYAWISSLFFFWLSLLATLEVKPQLCDEICAICDTNIVCIVEKKIQVNCTCMCVSTPLSLKRFWRVEMAISAHCLWTSCSDITCCSFTIEIFGLVNQINLMTRSDRSCPACKQIRDFQKTGFSHSADHSLCVNTLLVSFHPLLQT